MARLGCKVDICIEVYAVARVPVQNLTLRAVRTLTFQLGPIRHVITGLSLEPRLSCAISLRIYQQFTPAKWLITGSYVTFSYDFPILLTRGTPRNALSVIQRKHYAVFTQHDVQ